MKLSAQLFADIVGDEVVARVSSAPVDERRQSARVDLGRRARVFPLIETSRDAGQPVLVRDISTHGIGMLMGEAMTPGDEFVIHLPTATASSLEVPVEIQCAVRRCQVGGSGQTQFLVGSTFELVLNRPLDYAVEMPTEIGTESQQTAPEISASEQWDTQAVSPAEGRFDEQLAQAMANRPQRLSIGEWLSRYRFINWIGRVLIHWLAPLIDLMHRLGIRNRLTRRGRERRADELQGESGAASSNSEAADAAVPFRERRLITALDSASHYTSKADALSGAAPEPASTYTSAASGRRPLLFAQENPSKPPAMAMPVAEQVISEAVPVAVRSSAVFEPPLDTAPVVVPAFELPAVLPTVLPTELRPPATVNGITAADPVVVEMSFPNPMVSPAQQELSVPAEEKSKKHHGAAWRGRHRLGWYEAPRNRPRLGR